MVTRIDLMGRRKHLNGAVFSQQPRCRSYRAYGISTWDRAARWTGSAMDGDWTQPDCGLPAEVRASLSAGAPTPGQSWVHNNPAGVHSDRPATKCVADCPQNPT